MSQAGAAGSGGGGGGGGASSFVTNNGTAVPLAGVLNVLGGDGIGTVGTGDTVTISANGGGYTWGLVTAASNPVQIVKSHGYICGGGAQVQFLLPAVAAVGDSFRIAGVSNHWLVSTNVGQVIVIGENASGTGVEATLNSDCIECVCIIANMYFKVISMTGNISVL